MKSIYLLTSAFLCVSGVGLSVCANAQCTVPAPPTSATCAAPGQIALTSNTSTASGSTYYYTGTGTLTNVSINAGSTLVVCGALTLTTPNFYGGNVIVESTGTLTVNDGNYASIESQFVNYGTLNLSAGGATNSLSINNPFWNYGSVNFTASPTFDPGNIGGVANPGGFYNGSSAASVVISGSLTTYVPVVINGDVTVKGTYTSTGTVCLAGGSQLGVVSLFAEGGSNQFTVSGSPGEPTATIGITGNFDTDGNGLTTTANLVLCEGPAMTNTTGNAGSATVHTNCTLAVLAVTLISFSAEAENNICSLKWATAKQAGLVNFEIEYSTDAVNYQTLTSVPAEEEQDDYSYTTALTANTWFRLKIVNQDSSASYSGIVPVTYQGGAAAAAAVLRIQPNLITGNTLQVWSNMSSAQSGEWEVVDMMGRTMMHQPAQLSAGTTTNTIQLPGLFSGMYHLLFINSQVKVSPVPFSVMR